MLGWFFSFWRPNPTPNSFVGPGDNPQLPSLGPQVSGSSWLARHSPDRASRVPGQLHRRGRLGGRGVEPSCSCAGGDVRSCVTAPVSKVLWWHQMPTLHIVVSHEIRCLDLPIVIMFIYFMFIYLPLTRL